MLPCRLNVLRGLPVFRDLDCGTGIQVGHPHGIVGRAEQFVIQDILAVRGKSVGSRHVIVIRILDDEMLFAGGKAQRPQVKGCPVPCIGRIHYSVTVCAQAGQVMTGFRILCQVHTVPGIP